MTNPDEVTLVEKVAKVIDDELLRRQVIVRLAGAAKDPSALSKELAHIALAATPLVKMREALEAKDRVIARLEKHVLALTLKGDDCGQ